MMQLIFDKKKKIIVRKRSHRNTSSNSNINSTTLTIVGQLIHEWKTQVLKQNPINHNMG